MDLATKLQLKAGQMIEGVLVPDTVLAELDGRWEDAGGPDARALIVFIANRAALERHRTGIVAAASEDRTTWVSYPKAGKLGTDLNRDTLAADLSESGIQPVRQIAVDDVWSALRFRPR